MATKVKTGVAGSCKCGLKVSLRASNAEVYQLLDAHYARVTNKEAHTMDITSQSSQGTDTRRYKPRHTKRMAKQGSQGICSCGFTTESIKKIEMEGIIAELRAHRTLTKGQTKKHAMYAPACSPSGVLNFDMMESDMKDKAKQAKNIASIKGQCENCGAKGATYKVREQGKEIPGGWCEGCMQYELGITV